MEKQSRNEFETAYKELQKMAEEIKKPDTTIEEAIADYENGMKYYKICDEILNNAKQKIEVFEGEV